MEKKISYGSEELDLKLEQFEPKVKRKALSLAKGIMSVYGLPEVLAVEEGIIRAKKVFEEKRRVEIQTLTIGAN
ncbi:MAG: hypothetical protein WA913_08135 [Pricia sp.]